MSSRSPKRHDKMNSSFSSSAGIGCDMEGESKQVRECPTRRVLLRQTYPFWLMPSWLHRSFHGLPLSITLLTTRNIFLVTVDMAPSRVTEYLYFYFATIPCRSNDTATSQAGGFDVASGLCILDVPKTPRYQVCTDPNVTRDVCEIHLQSNRV